MTLISHSALYCIIRVSLIAHHASLNEDYPYYYRQKCSPGSLVSDSINFVWIFAGVLGRGGIKRQWAGIKWVIFSVILHSCECCCDLQWARDLFEGLYRQPVETAKQFLTDSRFIDRVLKLPGSQPVCSNI